ncbi:MAG TPA: hypothetical protein VGM30_17170 [Puia sp.]|jgi:hypothetical protein
MKSQLIICFLLALIRPALAQESSTSSSYKVIPIISKETFTLNSGGRALFGGKSRIDLTVELPANTVEWYYALTTTPEKAPAPTIGLAEQLIKYLTPAGIASSVMSALMTPNGTGTCDVYLFADQNNLNRFLGKQPQFSYLMSGTRQNFNQGAVQVRDAVKGSFFLGLRNPSGLSAVQITIEVCAIVKD